MSHHDTSYFDIEALIKALGQHCIDYVLIGTVGAIAHGARLHTEDLDICNSIEEDNLRALASTLQLLDATPFHKTDEHMNPVNASDWRVLRLDDPTMHHLYQTRCGLIDIVPEPFGSGGWGAATNYETLMCQASTIQVFGCTVQVAAFVDIYSAKRALGRPQDVAAADELKRINDLLNEGIQPEYGLEKYALERKTANV